MCIYHNLFPTRESDAFCPDITPLELLSSLFQKERLHEIRDRCLTRSRNRPFEYTDVLCYQTTVKHYIRDGQTQFLEDEFECEQCQAIIESGGWKGRTFDEIVRANNNFQPLSTTSAAAPSLTDSEMEESAFGDDFAVEYEGDYAISFKTEPSSAGEASFPKDFESPNDDQQTASEEEPDKAASPTSLIQTAMMAENAAPAQINEAAFSSSRHETTKDKGKATMTKRLVDKEDDVEEQHPKRQKRRSTSSEKGRVLGTQSRFVHALPPSLQKSSVGQASAKTQLGKAPMYRSRRNSSGSTLIEISSDSDAETFGSTASESETELASTSVNVATARQEQQHPCVYGESADKSQLISACAQMVSRRARRKLEDAFNAINAKVVPEEVIRIAVKDGSFTRALEAMMNVENRAPIEPFHKPNCCSCTSQKSLETAISAIPFSATFSPLASTTPATGESQASEAHRLNTHRLREINAEITNQLAAALEESAQGKKREACLAAQLANERRNNLKSGAGRDSGLVSQSQDTSLPELTELRQKVTDLTKTLENATNEKSDTDINTKKLEATIQELKNKLPLHDLTNESTNEEPALDNLTQEHERLNTQINKVENDMAIAQARAATKVKPSVRRQQPCSRRTPSSRKISCASKPRKMTL